MRSFALLFLLLASGRVAIAQQVDLVIQGGRIVTVDSDNPEVEAVAVRNGRIEAVGKLSEIRPLIGDSTRVIDLQGRFAMPGFIEGHAHFLGLGQSKMMLDLRGAETWDQIVAQVAEAARITPAGQWIVGRGWHQSKWKETPRPSVEGYPVHETLSAVTPNHPVLLTHASGHMSFANAKAMQLADVDATTSPPAGGEILRDSNNSPTGVFRETAQGLISRARASAERRKSAEQRSSEMRRAFELASQECLKYGITSFQDAGSSFATVDALRDFAEAGKLPVRLYVMIRDSNVRMAALLPRYRMIGLADQHLTVRALKRSIDGALGPHGAWLLHPYDDLPNSAGLNTATVPSVEETANLAIKHQFQLCVHAIGDRANRETLDIFERAFADESLPSQRRWRVEHAQHLDPQDIPRFAQLGVIASMQGVHCTSDAIFVPQRLGPRRSQQGAYVWQSLIQSGAIVTNGTDAPVEDLNPIPSFYASVTRKLSSGVTFYPEQCMTRMQALRSYTLHAAYAAFEEDLKGSLEPGKLADITVLSQDILSVPEEQLLKTQVDMTIVGGQVLYERK